MNFKGHCIGGALASATVMGILYSKATCLGIKPTPTILISAGLSTFFFSLFPDIDTQSVIQKWFYRALFLCFLYLYSQKAYQLASILAIMSTLPLLSHHRAWTHHPFSLFWFPILLAGIYDYTLSIHSIWHRFSINHVIAYLNEYTWLIMSSGVGWSTHLILDTRWARKFRRQKRR